MALISIRICSHVKESKMLTRADNLCINNYIRVLLNNIVRRNVMVRTGLEPVPCRKQNAAYVSDALSN